MNSIEIGGLRLEIASSGDPASEEKLECLRAEFPDLPMEYLDVIRRSNGLTGDFGEESEYVVFYSIDQVSEWNRSMNVPTNEHGFAIVGGNGGLDGFFVSTTGDGRWMVLPLMDIGARDVRLEDKFKSITDFVQFLAHRYRDEH